MDFKKWDFVAHDDSVSGMPEHGIIVDINTKEDVYVILWQDGVYTTDWVIAPNNDYSNDLKKGKEFDLSGVVFTKEIKLYDTCKYVDNLTLLEIIKQYNDFKNENNTRIS